MEEDGDTVVFGEAQRVAAELQLEFQLLAEEEGSKGVSGSRKGPVGPGPGTLGPLEKRGLGGQGAFS